MTRGRFIVVEYTLSFIKSLSTGAQVRIRAWSSETDDLRRGLVPAVEQLINISVGFNLGKKLNNPHLRAFKVMEIGASFGEVRVLFTNDVKISPSESHHFSVNDIDNNESAHITVADANLPIPDFIGRAADETHLTRVALWRIFEAVNTNRKATLQAHPEGWANTFVRVVSDTVRDHIVERLRFRDTGKRDPLLADPESAFPESESHVQRELIDGGPKSLYDRVQVDSDVERTFVNDHLRKDGEQLVVYFKFPNAFRIGLPKIIGDYNPDWGILRHNDDKTLTLELVRETKGADDLEKLRFLNEGRKLILAERYFQALGIDYRFISPSVKAYWESREQAAARSRAQLRIGGTPKRGEAVVVYDLVAAASSFSGGHDPISTRSIEISPRKARRPGLFIAKITGNSMNRVAPDGAWCLWQHLGHPDAPAASPGELLIVRKRDPHDPTLGAFTFKRWVQRGEISELAPMSTDPSFRPLPLSSSEDVRFIARFVEVLHLNEGDIQPPE